MGMKWMCFILLVSLILLISSDDANGVGDSLPTPPPPPNDPFLGGGENDPGPNTVSATQPIWPPPSLAPPVYPQAETDYYMAIPVNETGQERAWCYRDCGRTLTCPAECPLRVPANNSMQGCFIDCSNCEATCKWRQPNCDNYGPSCYGVVQPPPSSPSESPPTPPVDPPPSAFDPPPSDWPPSSPPYDGEDNDPGLNAVPNYQPVYPPPSLAPPVYPLADTDYYMAIPVNATGQERAWCFRDCGMTLTCPADCPLRVPSNTSMKGCFIDCSQCEATCKCKSAVPQKRVLFGFTCTCCSFHLKMIVRFAIKLKTHMRQTF